MKFELALKLLPTKKKMTRDVWPYYLCFNKDGYLILKNNDGEISPYVISEYDLNYDWDLID